MSRLTALRARMRERNLDALLVSKPVNAYYLSGFAGADVLLVVTADLQMLITDFRYFLQAEQESPDWTLMRVTEKYAETVRLILSGLGKASVGFEPDHLTVNSYYQFGGEDPDLPYQLVPASGIVEGLRLVKEPAELEAIREAVRLADVTYTHLLTVAKPGVTERELAIEAELFMRRAGADAPSFDIIVAAGPNAALPHAIPGERALQPGDLVVIDMGARKSHYCSDMTRTFAVAEAPPIAQEIYRITLQAQLAGVHGIRPGMTGREADHIVRRVIADAGYVENFGHGTGHGVGLEVHENPRVNRISEEELPVGCLITVEPGIYLPDIGGVRIEDLCVMTKRGLEPLTASAKPDELPVVG